MVKKSIYIAPDFLTRGASMPISGLVLTLDPAFAPAIARRLEGDPRFELGPSRGSRMPVCMETPSPEEERAAWDWLHGLSGVRHVDVAFVQVDPPSTRSATVEPEP